MGTIKNAVYKVDNGTDFDEINFRTSALQVTQDATHRFITDVERTKWNMPNGASYVKLPSGHVIQWGFVRDVPYSGIIVTLPLAYTTVLTLSATTGIGSYSAGAEFLSTSQVKIFNPLSSTPIPYVYWMTIGVI